MQAELSRCLNAGGMGRQDFETETLIPVIGGCFSDPTHALRADGFDASEDGTGRGTPIIPILEISKGTTSRGDGPNGCGIGESGDPMFTLQAGAQHAVAFGWNKSESQTMRVGETTDALQASPTSNPAIAFDTTQITSKGNYSQPKPGDPCHPLAESAHPPAIAERMRVRRLTPRECERLQGFPDDYTLIDRKGKPTADGPRYRAIGNAMCVNVLRWIGQRIKQKTELDLKLKAGAA